MQLIKKLLQQLSKKCNCSKIDKISTKNHSRKLTAESMHIRMCVVCRTCNESRTLHQQKFHFSQASPSPTFTKTNSPVGVQGFFFFEIKSISCSCWPKKISKARLTLDKLGLVRTCGEPSRRKSSREEQKSTVFCKC